MNTLPLLRGLAAGLVLALAGVAHAQSGAWPQKPVRIVLPTPPGASIDVILRLLQPGLQAKWKQPVLIDNKPGAGGNIAVQEVLRTSDGHTLFGGPDTVVTVNPHIYRKLPFDPQKDLVPVTYLASFQQMLVCNPKEGIGNVTALVRRAREKSLTYASSGAGAPSHMAMEMFLHSTGVKMTHVPYRGPAPAAVDVAGGQVPCGFLNATAALPLVKDGRLSALAVSGGARSPQAPAVPTIAEDAVPGFDATFFETLQAPRDLPADVVRKIQVDIAELLQSPDLRARLAELDLTVVASTPSVAAKRNAVDYAKWGGVAKRIQLQLD